MLDAVLSADAALRAWLTSYHHDTLDLLMIGLSAIGRGGAVWLGIGLLLALRRPSRTRGVWQLALAIGLTSLLVNQAIKPAVGRPRPFEASGDVRLIDRRPGGASFPSGHAANAAAGAYAVSRIWPEGAAVAWTLAALISFSRIYVGAHYPLDVLAGAFVGWLCVLFVLDGTRWTMARSPLRGFRL